MVSRQPQSAGYIVWFTGLSGAGKTTLATALHRHLATKGPVEVLDGDQLRKTLCSDLTYSREDRNLNVDRIAWVARLLARHRIAAVVAAISPYRLARDRARWMASSEGIDFVEVFVRARFDTLISRDTKGLYAHALAGTLPNFTGVSDPYEEPAAPELVLDTDVCSISGAADVVLSYLAERGLVQQ